MRIWDTVVAMVPYVVAWYLIMTAVDIVRSLWELRRAYRELEELKEAVKNMAIPAKLEIHHDIMYLFRADNDSFMAQGATAAELVHNLMLRFGTKRDIRVVEGEEVALNQLEFALARYQTQLEAQARLSQVTASQA